METLITEINAFCDRHNLPPTRFGMLALNDKAFVSQVKAGRRIWPETEVKVRHFMTTYRPTRESAAA